MSYLSSSVQLRTLLWQGSIAQLAMLQGKGEELSPITKWILAGLVGLTLLTLAYQRLRLSRGQPSRGGVHEPRHPVHPVDGPSLPVSSQQEGVSELPAGEFSKKKR